MRGNGRPAKPGRNRGLIHPASRNPLTLSFVNVVEAHVLEALRRQYGVSLSRIRRGVEYLEERLGTPHPLATQKMLTDGRSLFVEAAGIDGREDLINASQHGQLAMRDLLALHLRRIEWDRQGRAARFFPFVGRRTATEDAPAVVALDPRVSFGRPIIARRGVPTAVIADRFQAGESIDDLAKDYGAEPFEIQEAIRCEFQRPRAA